MAHYLPAIFVCNVWSFASISPVFPSWCQIIFPFCLPRNPAPRSASLPPTNDWANARNLSWSTICKLILQLPSPKYSDYRASISVFFSHVIHYSGIEVLEQGKLTILLEQGCGLYGYNSLKLVNTTKYLIYKLTWKPC